MMKMSKKLLSLLLCAVMVLGSVAIGGDGFSEVLGNVIDVFSVKASAADSWGFDDETGTLSINTEGNMASYSSNNQPWNSYKADIKSVVIGEEVTSIGNYAFYGFSKLESITILGEIVSVGSYAFYNCTSLKSVEMGYCVTTIGQYAFYNCTSLTEITIPASLTTTNYYYSNSRYYERGPFTNCSNLKKAVFEEGITSIPAHIFGSCTGLEEVILPDSVTSIGTYAFSDCGNLVINQLPPELITLSGYAFRNCKSITEINIPKSLLDTGYYSLYNSGYAGPFSGCSNLNTVSFEEGSTEVSSYLFQNCTGLETIDIVDTITAIESNAFYGDTSLKEVTFSSAITSIGSEAFYNCTSLKSVEMEDYVTSIGDEAFYNCTSMSELKLSKRLSSIHDYAFYNCTSLTEVNIPASLTTTDYYYTSSISYYQRGPFTNCSNLKKAVFEEGMSKIPGYIFGSCTGLEEVILPDSVTSIGSYAFHSCPIETINLHDNIISVFDHAFYACPLSSIALPANLKTIGSYSFSKTKFRSLVIPANVTSVGSYAFAENINLTSIEFLNTTTTLDSSLFYGCSALTDVQLPQKLTKISESMFYDCSSLRKIDIPDTVTIVESNAFRNSAIENISFESNITSIGSYVMYNNDSLKSVYIANGTVGNYAFYDCDSLTDVSLSPYVSSIGNYSFAFCEVLKDIVINTNTITSTGTTVISESAFTDSPSLEVVTLPKSVKSIGKNAFHNCPRLREITIPITVTSIEPTAFSYPDRMIIKGVKKSEAENYANTYDYQFVDISKPITGLVLRDSTEDTISIVKGSYYTPVFDYFPSDTTDIIVLTTANAAIAYITDNRIYGNKQGTTTITATASSGLTYDFTVNVTTVNSIEITALPTKTVYEYGQPLDTSGLVVTAHFSDGTSNPVVDYTINGYNANVYGKQVIKVTYGGKTATFEVEVLDDRIFVEGIEITKLPDKLTYKKGENLITDGMIVTASYSNGTAAAVTEYVTSAINVLKTGKQTITVTYEGFTDTFEIEVLDFYVTDISILTPALKTEYYVGDELNTEGLTLKVSYSDNSEEIVSSGFTCTPRKLETAGSQEITIEYVDEKVTYNVNVANIEVESITVASNPSKTTYYVGDTLNTRGLKLTVKYNSGKTESVTSGFECTPKSLSRPGSQKITVIYSGAIASFNVAVLEVEIESLEIKKLPQKLTYFSGNSIDISGLELTAKYNNGSAETVTKGYTFSPDVVTSIGTTKITVTYKEKTVSFDVTVQKVSIDRIVINTMPEKTEYNVGSTLDKKGLSIKAVYNDGSYEIIDSGFICTPEKLDKAGTQTVKVEYKGYETGFDVAVNKFNLSNRYNFSNSSSNFKTSWSGSSYYMTNSDMTKLVNYIKKAYIYPDSTISMVQSYRNSSWGGSCYGMAATSLLDFYENINFNENFDNNARSMYNVKSPSSSTTIMSAINYYHVSQYISRIYSKASMYIQGDSDWAKGLKELEKTAQKCQPFLFCYYFSNGGHAIVAYDYQKNNDGSYNITAYDNRYPSNNITIKIDKNYSSCTVVTPYRNEYCTGIEFYPDINAFDIIDIDGPNNDMVIKSTESKSGSNTALLEIPAISSITVTNNKNEKIKVNGTEISGDMEILSKHFIVNTIDDGEPAPVTFILEVQNSESFSFKTTAGEMNVSVLTNDMYASYDSGSSGSVEIIENEGIYVTGNNVEYTATLSSENNDYDTITVNGTTQNGSANVTYDENENISAHGNISNVTIYRNITEVESYDIDNGGRTISIIGDNEPHVHEGTKWHYNETNHWHKCTCGQLFDNENHNFGAGIITKPATETETGTITYSCSICGYSKTEIIPVTPSENTKDTAIAELNEAKKNAVSDEAKTIIDEAIERIEAATDDKDISSIKEMALADAANADKTLADAKTAANAELNTAKNNAKSNEAKIAIDNGKNAVNSATNVIAVNTAKTEAISKATDADKTYSDSIKFDKVSIKVAGTKTIDYRSIVSITATATDVPTDCKLVIYVNGSKVATGDNKSVSYSVGELKSDITYTVKVVDAKGNVQKDSNGNDVAKDGGKITCKAGFFQKLIAFFKGLFGSLPMVEVKP